ncbi:MAG: flagellin [Phenylobacterium sp.]|nr:flagellin [Phenylobacterium sp.]
MVTSVNGASLAALLAQESALANRTSTTPAQTDPLIDPGQSQDPAAVFTGSSDASLSAILGVQDSLNRAASISDVGISAGKTISDLLSLVREKAVAAQSASTSQDKTALDADYQKLLQTIDQLAKSAAFQGVTPLSGGSGGDLQFKTDATGEATAGLTPQDFTVGGPTIGLAGTNLLGSPSDLAKLLGQVDAAGGALSTQLSQMSAQSSQIQAHLSVVGQLQSALAGQGTTDLNADSARLQALQVQQMLAGQSQSVANQAPQALLSLFR